MQCVKCQAESDLEVVAKLASAWDDPRAQEYKEWVLCRLCGATYYATLTDTFFSDDFRIETYTADAQPWQETYALARACPRPDNHECSCPAHTQIRKGLPGHGQLVRDDWVYYND